MTEVSIKLPDRTITSDAWGPRCPWCRAEIDDLAIPIGALQTAWEDFSLTGKGNWLYKDRPFSGAEVDCPRCARPLLVKFVHDEDELEVWKRTIVIAPVMTAKDAVYLSTKAGVS